VTRKAWNDDTGKLVKTPGDGADPFTPVDPSERRPDALSVACRDCNAKPGEKCGSLLPPWRYLEIPHFARGRS
jgi:hypothetical protein